MRSPRLWALPVAMAVSVALSAPSAVAQHCLGMAAFSAGAMQLGAKFESASYDDGTSGSYTESTYGADFGYGAKSPLFLRAGIEHTSDEFDETANGFSVGGGWAIQPASAPKLQVCPQATFGYSSWDFGDGFTEKDNMIKVGLGAGVSASQSESFELVPYASLSFVRFGWSSDEYSDSETGYHFDLGAGLVFNKKFTVRPMVRVPMSLEGHNTAFGVAASLSFGSPAM
jgi:hypothetical protein